MVEGAAATTPPEPEPPAAAGFPRTPFGATLARIVSRNIFLILGAIVGVVVAAPIVLTYATVWWWLSVPAVLAYAAVLWRWGLAWIADDDDANDAPLLTKLGGVLILLLWSFIGVALAVFLATLAARNWPMIVLALLVLAAFILAMWLSDVLKAKPKPAKTPPDPAPPPPADRPDHHRRPVQVRRPRQLARPLIPANAVTQAGTGCEGANPGGGAGPP